MGAAVPEGEEPEILNITVIMCPCGSLSCVMYAHAYVSYDTFLCLLNNMS